MRTTASILLLVLCPVLAVAGTLLVPDPYPTLADAIAAANPCDTIILAPGTYSGPGFQNLVLDNRCLTIMSTFGPDSTTINPAGQDFLTISDTLLAGDDYVTVRDLNLINSNLWYERGGRANVINCHAYNFSILDSVVSGYGRVDSCRFDRAGVGLADSVHQIISNNLFFNCSGNGISAQFAQAGIIIDNFFVGNHTGIEAYFTRDFIIERNVFVNNTWGIIEDGWSVGQKLNHNCFWNNKGNFFNFSIPPDATGNIYDQDPRFCNLPETDRSVMADSPLLPENNGRTLIGNVTLACRCGDIDSSGHLDPNIADLTFLIGYLFRSGLAPAALAAADVNGSGDGTSAIDIADVTYLVAFLFRAGPPPVC